MALVALDSPLDPRLESYRQLKRTNRTRWADEFVVESELLVDRLLASPFPVKSVVVAEHRWDAWRGRLARLPAETPIYVLPASSVSELVGFKFHRGVLACAARMPTRPLAELIAPAGGGSTLIVCPETRDPENLGAIFRSAAALGADAALLGEKCVDPLSRRVLRVSMGAALRLPTRRAAALLDDLEALRAAGYELVAAVVGPGAEPLTRFTPAPRTALLVGNEAHGLDPDVLAHCPRRVSIPMAEGVDSLNVAVATGILLYRFLAAG